MDIIDFIGEALGDKSQKRLGKSFVLKLKTGKAENLQKWFVKEGFKDISLEDCEKLIKNKDLIAHNAQVSLKGNY